MAGAAKAPGTRGSAHATARADSGDDQRAGDAPQRPAVLRGRDETHGAPGLATLLAVRDGVLVPVLRAVHHPRSTSSPTWDRPDRLPRTRPIRARPRQCWLVECSAGGRAPLIERYALPE